MNENRLELQVFRQELRALPGYRSTWHAIDGRLAKLNHNERTTPLPAAIRAAVLERLGGADWHRYPDPDATGLRQRLAAVTGVDPGGILVGNGGNDLIGRVFAALRPDATVVLCTPGYPVYQRQAAVLGLAVREVPLTAMPGSFGPFALDVPAVLAAAAGCAAPVLCLASPNNPTGNCLDAHALSAVVAAWPGLCVVDEAYCDYSGRSLAAELTRFGNLLLLRTLSKAYGLAGVRLGYLLGAQHVCSEIAKVAAPYSVGILTQVCGEVLLDHAADLAADVAATIAERDRLATALRHLPGAEVAPSDANFLLVRCRNHLNSVRKALTADMILVRDLAGIPGLADCLRIGIGTPAENHRVLAAIDRALT